eukprot:3260176-Ditylum_brightwellii.AAC.1
MGPEFILSTLISIGRFSAEQELLLHNKLFCHAKLVGNEDDADSLGMYSNKVMYKYASTQLVYFLNGQRMIDALIIKAGGLFDSVIIHDEILITEMPAVQLSALHLINDELFDRFQKELKKDVVKAAIREFGEAYLRCKVLSPNELLTATKDKHLDWDPVCNFRKSPQQSNKSYNKQLFAIK